MGFPTLTVFPGQFLPDPRFVGSPPFCLGRPQRNREVCKRCTEEKVGEAQRKGPLLTQAMFWTQGWRVFEFPKKKMEFHTPLSQTCSVWCIIKLLLISINFTPKTSHCCLKKRYTTFSRYLHLIDFYGKCT